MKKMISLLIFAVLVFNCAAAEQTTALTGSRYEVDLPDGMKYSPPEKEDSGIHAYISDVLEMDWLCYDRQEAAALGLQPTLLESAEKLAESGAEAELREIGGIEALVYRLADDADGAEGIGYIIEDGDLIVEVIFWYATQEAADTAKAIMESIRTIQN